MLPIRMDLGRGRKTINYMDTIIEKVFDFYKVDVLKARSPIRIPQTRDTLPNMFQHLGYRIGAEIGVEYGRFSETLANGITGVTLYSIDAWSAYSAYREHVTQAKLERIFAEAQKRLAGKSQIIREYSDKASEQFADDSLDFVYIDANHQFLNVTQDIHYWSAKVRSGGIVAGHDFKRHKGSYANVNHVKDVVQAWAYAHNIKVWFILEGDKSPSWFWVKR